MLGPEYGVTPRTPTASTAQHAQQAAGTTQPNDGFDGAAWWRGAAAANVRRAAARRSRGHRNGEAAPSGRVDAPLLDAPAVDANKEARALHLPNPSCVLPVAHAFMLY